MRYKTNFKNRTRAGRPTSFTPNSSRKNSRSSSSICTSSDSIFTMKSNKSKFSSRKNFLPLQTQYKQQSLHYLQDQANSLRKYFHFPSQRIYSYIIRSFDEFHLRAQVTFTNICSIYTRFLSQ